jgi:hypothetical protein
MSDNHKHRYAGKSRLPSTESTNARTSLRIGSQCMSAHLSHSPVEGDWPVAVRPFHSSKRRPHFKIRFWEELIAYFPWYMGHIENDASNNSSIVACVFVTAVTFLPSSCLATIGGYTDTHTKTAAWYHKPTLFFQNKERMLKIWNQDLLCWRVPAVIYPTDRYNLSCPSCCGALGPVGIQFRSRLGDQPLLIVSTQ